MSGTKKKAPRKSSSKRATADERAEPKPEIPKGGFSSMSALVKARLLEGVGREQIDEELQAKFPQFTNWKAQYPFFRRQLEQQGLIHSREAKPNGKAKEKIEAAPVASSQVKKPSLKKAPRPRKGSTGKGGAK